MLWFIDVMELETHEIYHQLIQTTYFLCLQVPCCPVSAWQQDVGQRRLQFHRRPAGRSHLQHGWVSPPFPYERLFFFCVHQEVAVLVFSKNHYGCIHNPSVAFCVVYIHHSVIEHEPLIWSDSVKSNSVFKHLWLGVRPITPGCLHIDFGHWSSNP